MVLFTFGCVCFGAIFFLPDKGPASGEAQVSILLALQMYFHRNLKLEGECLVEKWTIFLVKQGKFKVGAVPAD
jgi:hypothetical protein